MPKWHFKWPVDAGPTKQETWQEVTLVPAVFGLPAVTIVKQPVSLSLPGDDVWRRPIVQAALAQTPSGRGWDMELDISLREANILSKFICPPRDMPKGLMRGYSFVAD